MTDDVSSGGKIFLSTLSLRRATADCPSMTVLHCNFYPRSPYGERLRKCQIIPIIQNFYPRSPYGERPPNAFRHCTTYLFLSTLSLRRATGANRFPNAPPQISIHALLTESDGTVAEVGCMYYISIHALLTESDRRRTYQQDEEQAFLSTLSLRRATMIHQKKKNRNPAFLSTLSLRRATGLPADQPSTPGFLSTLSLRRATKNPRKMILSQVFLSTLSLRRATQSVPNSL